MRRIDWTACLILAMLVGCGQSEPVINMAKAPHGGTIAALPDGLGNVELVREEVSGKPDQARLLLYFIDPAGKPSTAAPTTASLKPRERGAAPVGFKPVAGENPAQAGALASPPFRVSGDIAGELVATIGGKAIAVTVNVR